MTPQIVGRDAELLAINELIDSAIAGRGSTMLVVGEAGIGKSRLALATAKRAAERAVRVLTGGAIAIGDEPLRHAALIEILDRLDNEPAPSAGRTTDEMLELTLTALRQVAREPVVVIIEDLHWADRGTCQVVMALSRFARALPMLILVTARDDELPAADPRSRFLAELGRSELVTVVRLARLTRGQIIRQIELLLGPGVPTESLNAIVERSDGNPLLVEELSAFDDQHAAPHALLDVLAGRYHRLSDEARLVVAALAVAGRPEGDDAVADVTGLSPAAVRAALEEARDNHLLEVRANGLDFRHVVLADAIRQDLLPDHRAELHRGWATACTEADRFDDPASLAIVAHHWDEGNEPARAMEVAWRGAQLAERVLAADLAHAQYRRVIELWDRVPDAEQLVGTTYVQAVVHAAEVANRSGRPDAAVEMTRNALNAPDVDSTTAAILYERTGWYLLRGGNVNAARTAYREAVDRAELQAPDDLRARVLAGSVRIWERVGEHERAVSVARDALSTALDSDDPIAIGQARYMLGHALMMAGDLEAAEEELLAAADAAETNLDFASLGWAHIALAGCAGRRGRLRDAVDGALASAQRLRARGESDPAGAIASGVAAGLLIRLGESSRARKIGLQVLGETNTTIGSGLGHLILGLCDVDALELTSARTHLDEARAMVAPLFDGRLLGMLALGRIDLVLAEGTPELAAAIVREAILRVHNTGDEEMLLQLAIAGLRAEGELTRRAAHAGALPASAQRDERVDYLAGFVERVATLSGDRSSPELVGAEAAVAADRALLEGHDEPELWERAAEAWSDAQWPRVAVYARMRKGEALAANGDSQAAIAALEAAFAEATAIESRFLEADVHHAAERAGVELPEPPMRTTLD